MRRKGRGHDYKKALFKNLVKSAITHKKIVTTLSKAKRLRSTLLKEYGGSVRTVQLKGRKGDNAPQVLLEWQMEDDAKDKNNKNGRDKKGLASR